MKTLLTATYIPATRDNPTPEKINVEIVDISINRHNPKHPKYEFLCIGENGRIIHTTSEYLIDVKQP